MNAGDRVRIIRNQRLITARVVAVQDGGARMMVRWRECLIEKDARDVLPVKPR